MSPKTPLLDPADYFRDRLDPFMPGAGVFVLYVVVELALAYLLVQFMLDRVTGLSPGERSMVRSELSNIFVAAILVAVVAWFVVAVVMHFGVGGPETRGSFGDAMGVAGWAYAPEIVTAIPIYLYARHRIAGLDLDTSDPQAFQAEVESLAGGTADGVLVLLLLAVTVWSVYILAKGVSETHDVSLSRATLPAVVVGIGSFVLTLAA